MPQGSPPPQQYPVLFLLSMAAVSLWGWLLFSLSPQLGVWFWAGNPIQLLCSSSFGDCMYPCQHHGEPRTSKDRSRTGSFWGSPGSAWLFQGSGFAGAGEPLSAHRAVTYAGSVGD